MAATIDVVVLTRNEAKNIPDCLASFQGLGRAVVIDDESGDETVALAEAAGAVVHSRRLDDFAGQRNFALAKTSADWVFFLDADERFTPELIEGVRRFVEGGPRVGSVRRINFAFGRRHRFGRLAPDRVSRLFPKGAVQWVGRVHEIPVSDLPSSPVSGALIHHTYDDWSRYLDKFVLYTRLWAEEEYKRGRRSSVLKACAHALTGFLQTFLMRLGVLEGPLGWALCWYHGAYNLTKYLLLRQKHLDGKNGGGRVDAEGGAPEGSDPKKGDAGGAAP